MLSRNQVKYYSSLRYKKFRNKFGVFLAEGNKIVQELTKQSSDLIRLKTLLALPEFLKQEENWPKSLKIIEISEEDLKRISSLTTPNQAILEIEIPNYTWVPEDILSQYSFFLDNIQDPGNLGTIIRIADWFGINHIFCSPGSVDVFNPKVIQSTMGSFARIKVHYEMSNIFTEMPEFSFPEYLKVAAVLEGESIYEANLGNGGIIFFGNESKGLEQSIIDRADKRISILRYPGHSGAESLNISSAAAIFGSELLRRKLTQSGN